MYRRDVVLLGWVTILTRRLPCECVSCGWRGWWAPEGKQQITHAGRTARVLLMLEGRLGNLAQQVPASPAAFKGAALLGVLGGVLAALVALSVRATSPPATIDDAVALEQAAAAQPQPIPPAPLPVPEAVPATLPSPVPDPPALAADAPAPTSGTTEKAVAKPEPRTQPPPPPRIAGYRGGLQIESDPDGARVSIDGEEVGLTPIHLNDLPVGSRVVRVEAEGYVTWTTAARVVANQRARVSAVLQRSAQR